VTALVEGESVEVLGEEWRHEVPDAAGGGEAVEEDEGTARAAPVEVVEADGGAVGEAVWEGDVDVVGGHGGTKQCGSSS
jgi:hypothetical protein